MTFSPVDLNRFLHDLADASGAAILPFFRSRLSAEDKSHGGVLDPVTEADKAAEVVIRRMIKSHFPTHGIHGEEFGIEQSGAELSWIIDPIDGTRAFIAGLPVWGTLIGLARTGAPSLGLMDQPFTGERFWGDGRKSHWRGPTGERALLTRETATLANATLMTTTPKLFKGAESEKYEALEREVKLARYGCDCYAYAMIAAGHVDCVIETGLKTVDILPLIPIIEGAGGIVTDWEGNALRDAGNASIRALACGDKRVHEQALKILAR